VAPVPPLHLGYDRALRIVRELAAEGVHVNILLADFHAVLSYGLDLEASRHRKAYYYSYIREMCGKDVKFHEGTQFQSRHSYTELLFYWQRFATIADVKSALPSAVAKSLSVQTNVIATYTYTLMQVVDPLYLGVDAVLGDCGQQKIYDLGPALMKKMKDLPASMPRGYPSQLYFDVPCDLKGLPIGQSKASTRISIHETEASLEQKIRGLYAPPAGQPEAGGRENMLLALFRDSVFPWTQEAVRIPGANGAWRGYDGYSAFEHDYLAGRLHPNDCKATLLEQLRARMGRIQSALGTANSSWINMDKVR
jgi:tyrosyl-tRNA synthetase